MSEESLLSTPQEAEAAPVDAPVSEGPAVERPEWLLDKYATEDRDMSAAISEQAKAYVELQKQFGGFTGAPEEYSFELPEGVDGEVDTELEAYSQFTEIAKAANMSQETAQQLFNVFVGYQNQMQEQFAVDFNREREALGPQADQRIQSIAQWAGSNLDQGDMQTLESMAMRADQIAVLEKIIGKTRNSPVPKTNQVDAVPTGYTQDQFHQDVNSEKYRTDRNFRAAVRKKAAGLYPGGTYT